MELFNKNTKAITKFRGNHYFLSNMYNCTVVIDGIKYSSSEAAFQAQKCKNPSDRELFCSLDGFSAKSKGKTVALREDWEQVKVKIMLTIVLQKFLQNPILAKMLVNTDDAQIIEVNKHRDSFWGVYNGNGKNYLGEILMIVRRLFKSGKIVIENDKCVVVDYNFKSL